MSDKTSRWRIFTNDVGPGQYSALREVSAPDMSSALDKVWIVPKPAGRHVDVIALPVDRKDLWPDEQTGKLSKEARQFIHEALKK